MMPKTDPDVGPLTPATDRVHLIDGLRAAALCGVILYNIVAMVGAFLADDLLAKAGPADLAASGVIVLLIEGKARACFALLFGIGFGLLMERASARGQAFTGFYLRRMAVLLAIGLFNMSVLFFGDILILYAVLGMAMLLFRNWGGRALLIGGLALIVVPPLLLGTIEAATGAPAPNLGGLTPVEVAALTPSRFGAYLGPDFGAYVAANWAYYLDHYRADTAETAIYDLGVLGLFLVGLWSARNAVLIDVERWRPFLRRVVWWCLPIGLVLSVVHGTRRIGIPADGVLYGGVTAAYAGLAIAAFGYAALLCLVLTRQGRPLQKALAPMGRMALTGYLGSNAIGAFVFYGWGLGRVADWSVGGLLLFGLAIFLGFCLFSAVWLRVFRFGPAEWVWRSLTYGRPQSLRPAPAADAGPGLAASAVEPGGVDADPPISRP